MIVRRRTMRRLSLNKCLVQRRSMVRCRSQKSSQSVNGWRRKTTAQSAGRKGGLCLLTTGGLISVRRHAPYDHRHVLLHRHSRNEMRMIRQSSACAGCREDLEGHGQVRRHLLQRSLDRRGTQRRRRNVVTAPIVLERAGGFENLADPEEHELSCSDVHISRSSSRC